MLIIFEIIFIAVCITIFVIVISTIVGTIKTVSKNINRENKTSLAQKFDRYTNGTIDFVNDKKNRLTKTKCPYCENMYDNKLDKCPHCGAGKKN